MVRSPEFCRSRSRNQKVSWLQLRLRVPGTGQLKGLRLRFSWALKRDLIYIYSNKSIQLSIYIYDTSTKVNSWQFSSDETI